MMKAFAVVLILALNFHCNTSFYQRSVAVTKRGRTSIFDQDAMTSKKSAFYKKPSTPSEAAPNTAITPESTVAVTISKEVNPMKARLVEEVTKEDVRAVQLESLLDAFQSAVEEKEQLIALESQILSEIRDVKMKVNDEIMLSELNVAIDEKSRLIDAERAICKEISAVSSSLASEIDYTREKIVRLQNVVDALPDAVDETSEAAAVDYQSLLKSSIDSSRSRDETVLELINIFDEATSKRGFGTADSAAETPKDTSSTQPSSTAIARLTMEEIREELKEKSNKELAEKAGKAVSKTAVALVAATSSLFTATASFIRSPEAKMSTEAVKSASRAVGEMGRNIKDAFSAASAAWEVPDKGTEEGLNRVIEGVRLVVNSAEVKAALSLLGDNAQKTAADAAKAAEFASAQLGKSLKNSPKWKAAVSDLTESLALLLSILSLSSSRLLLEVRADLNKQLPNAK